MYLRLEVVEAVILEIRWILKTLMMGIMILKEGFVTLAVVLGHS